VQLTLYLTVLIELQAFLLQLLLLMLEQMQILEVLHQLEQLLSISPGRGARVTGRVTLTKGEIITIVVGQRGESGTSTAANVYNGSGGGTFVVRKNASQPLFIAGGGTASSGVTPGRDAVLTRLGGSNSQGATSGLVVAIGGSAQVVMLVVVVDLHLEVEMVVLFLLSTLVVVLLMMDLQQLHNLVV
jgi:hypothetical protein